MFRTKKWLYCISDFTDRNHSSDLRPASLFELHSQTSGTQPRLSNKLWVLHSLDSRPQQNKDVINTVCNHLRHFAFDPQLWIHFEDGAPQWNPSNIFNLQSLPAGSWHMINTADARLFAACVMLMRSVGMCRHRAVNIAALIDRAWDWIYSHHLFPLALSHHVPYLFTPLCSFTSHLNIFIPPAPCAPLLCPSPSCCSLWLVSPRRSCGEAKLMHLFISFPSPNRNYYSRVERQRWAWGRMADFSSLIRAALPCHGGGSIDMALLAGDHVNPPSKPASLNRTKLR